MTIAIYSTETLTLELAGAASADQPEFLATWIDEADDDVGSSKGELNDTTPVTAVSSPASGHRIIKSLFVCNLDSASVTVIAKVTGDTTRTILRRSLASGEATDLLGAAKGEKGDTGETGATGATGDTGADGADGDDGVGVPAGGTTGQVLAKSSATDYDTEWVDQAGGSGGDMLSTLLNSEVSVTGTTALTSSAFGKFHKISDDGSSTQYTITLPDPSGNSGKFIGIYGGASTELTRFVKIAPYSAEMVGGLEFECIHVDKVIIFKCDGTNWQIVVNINPLTSDEQIDFDNSMTTAEMNSWLVCAPKDLGGNTLTVQFAAGSYTLTTSLDVIGFGNGVLNLSGDTSISSQSTAQNVILTGASSINTLKLDACTANVVVSGFKIIFTSSSANTEGAVNLQGCIYVTIQYCYLIGTNVYGQNLYCKAGLVFAQSNYFTYGRLGISSVFGSNITSFVNSSTGTMPVYGMSAQSGGVVAKNGATQPTGSTANELTSSGGVIR